MRKIDEGHLVFVVQHNVELVEIAVYKTVIGQVDDQVHDVIVDLLLIGHLVDLTQRIAVDELHDYGVSIEIDGLRHRKAVIVQSLVNVYKVLVFILLESSYTMRVNAIEVLVCPKLVLMYH